MTGARFIAPELPIPAARTIAWQSFGLRGHRVALDWRKGASRPAGEVAAGPTMHLGRALSPPNPAESAEK